VVIRVPESSSLYDYTNLLVSGYNIFVTISNGTSSGTSGALTNNETRAVTLTSDLIVGGAIIATNDTVSANSFIGDGGNLTGLSGTSISSGTVADARIASTITRDDELASSTNVIVQGLAAGSYAVAETALTGFLRFSSTNTAFVDGAATNAITVVSNSTSYASLTFSGASATARGFDGTYYVTSNPLVLTNGATKGIWIADAFYSGIIVTNTTYPDAGGDATACAAFNTTLAFPTVDDGFWVDNATDNNPLTVTTTESLAYSPSYASFNGKHVGDGSALVNVPAPAAGVVVETNVSFPVSGLSTVNANFFWQTTNASPGKIGFLTLEHGGGHGIAVVGGVSGDVVLNPTTEDGILQIGATGNTGNRIFLQYAMYPWASTNTVGISHPLEFRSRVWNGGAATTKYPGIVGFSEANNSSELGKLVFYARAPAWNAGNLNASAPNTAGTEVFSAGTNGVVAASGIRFKGDNFTVSTVTITSGSGSPESVVTAPIGSLFLRTDGSTSTTLYVKTSGTGNTGWTAK
jgi:hypothetical protein